MSDNNTPKEGMPELHEEEIPAKTGDFNNYDLNISEHISRSNSLDDEQRIKMLSPAMLVAKRFFRNKLAIIGLMIILAMFLFSFIGGWIHPYEETRIFYKKEIEVTTYASASINQNIYEEVKDGNIFTAMNKAAFILAYQDEEHTFSTKINNVDTIFVIKEINEDTQVLFLSTDVVRANIVLNEYFYESVGDFVLTDAFESIIRKAIEEGVGSLEYNGVEYFIEATRRELFIRSGEEYVILTKNIYDMYDVNSKADFSFKYAAETAMASGAAGFEANGAEYELEYEEESCTVYAVNGTERISFADISELIITPRSPEIFLSVEFKDAIARAMADGADSFVFTDASGKDILFIVEKKDTKYDIKTDTVVDLIDTYDSPSAEHWLGTDGSGMDLLVRLMYGGRVSLTIGFVVVLIEMVIGVIIGGLSGYFGGWVDTLLMRLVEIFNCIPTLPLYIILGVVLDTMKLDPTIRIYLLMVILGVTGWPGVARVVRGQILSLREQEFMVANEATGLSVSRRIFKHLVPNVIPQLIVYATMSLGGIILTEATLSFLNLGVKYPYASWGNIVNSVNDSFVLQNYWFVWIPAGFLILLTVLGFNFTGDGLRDAFDPKMKR